MTRVGCSPQGTRSMTTAVRPVIDPQTREELRSEPLR